MAKLSVLDGDTNEIVAEIDYTPISSSVVNPLWSAASTCDPAQGFEDSDALGIGRLRLFRGSDRHGQGRQRCLRKCGQSV